MLDPTREELIAFLETQVAAGSVCMDGWHTGTAVETLGDAHNGCGCRFDIEEAAYWLAAHYHGGQGSNLYSALSVSEFRPGLCDSDLPDDNEEEGERETSSELYRLGATWIETS